MNILIVDDSKAIRFKLRGILEELGHRVIAEAANGVEAIEAFRIHHPDLVTLDIVMPQMDGLQALAKLKELDANAKVVMVTSAASVSNMMEARKLGAAHFLIKPFARDKVEEVLARVSPEREAA